ncbi:MAG: AI-2E family transporter [Flavobacteriales bacterium]|jgi:predicted PurR-regulated permease PerM|nr:AI-2E family transporter [Flavobacteriales bacterium]
MAGTSPHPTPEEHPSASHLADPLYRYVLVLLAVIGTVAILSFGRTLFILLFVAGIFSFLLLPFCRRLERWRFPLWLAAAVSCSLLLVVIFGVLTFLGWQYAHFGKDLPALQQALLDRINSGQAYLESRFDVTQSQQTAWLNKELSALAQSGGALAMSLFSATGSALATAIIIPIVTFFLLLLKGRFREFFSRLRTRSDGAVLRVVKNISELSRQWLKGVLTVMLFLAVLNSIGFLALGLKYAILLAVTAAILNVVPYVGPWLGAIMPALVALLTKDSAMYAVGVVGVIAVTQFIDNNFITPKVVGSSVQINPLASILALIAWGSLWGLMGLILAIPITGMLKLVFDEIPSLKPWGFILGEEKTWPKEKRIKLSLSISRGSKKKTVNK